jgi:hypothetical protein
MLPSNQAVREQNSPLFRFQISPDFVACIASTGAVCGKRVASFLNWNRFDIAMFSIAISRSN